MPRSRRKRRGHGDAGRGGDNDVREGDLQAYLTRTIVRLQPLYCMSATELMRHEVLPQVIPDIVKSITRFSGCTPPAVQEEIRYLLTAYRVLPSYDVEITALEEALRKILVSVLKPLKHSPLRASMQLRVELAIAADADDSCMEQAPRCAWQLCGATADATPCEVHYDQRLLHDYAKEQWSKLSHPAASGKAVGKAASEKDRDVEFTAAVLPVMLKKLQQLSCHAPVELRVALARILVCHGVWPDGSVEIGGSQALPKLMKRRARGALQEICALLRRLTQEDSSGAYYVGLRSPVHIEVVAVSGDQVAELPLASGASVSSLRCILGAFMNCPADTVSLVRAGTLLDDKEQLTERCQVQMVLGDGPSMAGIFAGYTSDILVLYPDGRTSAQWYDTYYWAMLDCPIRDVPDVKQIVGALARGDVDAEREQPGEEEVPQWKQGSWTVITDGSRRFVKGTAYEPHQDNLRTFTFEVEYDRSASCEGNSPVTLYGLVSHHFSCSREGLDGFCRDNAAKGAQAFYFISELAATP
eukprot:TRINITY_DN13849_c0_g1_i1.p1 TRINITY_DN13849_c0_g1~~TRINITY_DN13849_c0_g1_i1.p1  ORF type:complete len:528 (+),score=62.98 TRINITY_DN13849_c0_g1_i1:93-1676(+)